ncbi:response regulator [Paenibacillus sp. 2RAB27]|uniref:response regulator n=1 Tax=Paenibacillus sp. 2RAB27 TaxID=3232991 RepID=UPI003F97C94D
MTRRYGGTGLGLVISQNLAELMHGTIQVKSELGKGSCFTLICQFDNATYPALPVEPSSDNRVVSEMDTAERYAVLRNARILLVEDNEINQIVATDILSQQGILVDVANNGLEAVRMAQLNTYDAILMDVQMPEMDGYEATRQIRRLPDQGDTPIIAITADAIKGVKEQVLEAGMNDYVTKPFEPIHLLVRCFAASDAAASGLRLAGGC